MNRSTPLFVDQFEVENVGRTVSFARMVKIKQAFKTSEKIL